MPEITPKLGLKKPLGNETFNRQSYNENLDLIEQNAETPAGAQAKAAAAETAAAAYTDQEVEIVRSDVTAHLAETTNPHNVTVAQIGAEPAFSKNTAFNKNFGTVAGTVCQGNDSRLSDVRIPTAHNHSASNINAGTLAIARIPTGTSSSTVCIGNDTRLSNARQCNNTFANVTTSRAALEVRKMTSGTADPTGGASGDIYFQR